MNDNLNYFETRPPVFFKKPIKYSYQVYREFFQVLDTTILDTFTYLYSNRLIVFACMYLVLGILINKGRNFGEFDAI